MNSDRYLRLFLDEARDHLSAAHRMLDRLESDPACVEPLRELMRHAHSLKGMAMSMGFETMAGLTHALEDLFEGLRAIPCRDARGLSPIAREALGVIGEQVDAVERGEGERSREAEQLRARLRALSIPGKGLEAGPESFPPSRPEALPVTQEPTFNGQAPPADGDRRWRIELSLRRTPRRTTSATVAVLRGLARLGHIEHVNPPLPSRDTGRFEGRLVLDLSSTATADTLEAELGRLAEIERYSARPLPAAPVGASAGGEAPGWMRVRSDLLDDLLDHAVDLFREQRWARRSVVTEDLVLRGHLERSEFLTKRLYDVLTKLRLVPFESAGHRLSDLVYRLSRELGKPVRFRIRGGSIQVDRSVLDALIVPLQHMVRNALDHGIESVPERRAAGKAEEATLTLEIERRAERLKISLCDDGRGLSSPALRRAAVERGVLTKSQAERLSDDDVFLLTTLPAFSTSARATRLSGRGVGLDVVRRDVERLGGRLRLRSAPARWTRVELSVPLTLALIHVVLFRSGGELFALPVSTVARTLSRRLEKLGAGAEDPSEGTTERLRLRDCLEPGPGAGRRAENEIVLRLNLERGPLDLVVDEMIGQRQIVVKPLGPPLNALSQYSGAALLEDGSVALVLNPETIGSAEGDAGARQPAR